MSAETKQLKTALEVAERNYFAAEGKLDAAHEALDAAQGARLAAGREVARLRTLVAKSRRPATPCGHCPNCNTAACPNFRAHPLD